MAKFSVSEREGGGEGGSSSSSRMRKPKRVRRWGARDNTTLPSSFFDSTDDDDDDVDRHVGEEGGGVDDDDDEVVVEFETERARERRRRRRRRGGGGPVPLLLYADESEDDDLFDEDEEEVPLVNPQQQQQQQPAANASDEFINNRDGCIGAGEGSSSGAAADGSISVILTDSEVLDCNICYDSLKIPVFQCENGHIACSSCCTKIKNKCPSCSFPIGYNRCRAIEKVIESVKVMCRNVGYGCNERISYNARKDHEDVCIHAPYTCPHYGCGFLGSSKLLLQHCSARHSSSIKCIQYNRPLLFSLDRDCKHIIFQEAKEGALFILNNSVEINGNAITVKTIGPMSSKRVSSYELLARQDINSLRIESSMENHSAQTAADSSCFLLVPPSFLDSNGQLKMELCIRLFN